MSAFSDLNRKKWVPMYFRYMIFFAVLAGLFFLFLYINKGVLPSQTKSIGIIFIIVFLLPAFMLGVAYIGWMNKNMARKKAFSIPAFNEIRKLGFVNALKNENHFGSFTEEIEIAELNGFTLLMDVSTQRNHIIEVEIPVKRKKLDKDMIELLTRKFNQHDVVFKPGKVIKEYNSAKPYLQSAEELYHELTEFTNLLKEQNFEPVNLSMHSRFQPGCSSGNQRL